MTNDQEIKSDNTKELTVKKCCLSKVMNDEELKDYLEGKPDAVCRYVKFLNSIRKGHVSINVFNDDSVVIETDEDELELTNLFENYYEE